MYSSRLLPCCARRGGSESAVEVRAQPPNALRREVVASARVGFEAPPARLPPGPGSARVCVPERAVCEQSERVDAIVDFVETSGVLSQFTQSLFVPAFLCLCCTRPTNLLASTSTCRPWLSPTSWPPSPTIRNTPLVHRSRRRLQAQPLVDPRKWL